jgi:hypothetical protein
MAGRVLSFSRTAPLPLGLENGPFCVISRTTSRKPVPSNSETEMESRASAVGLGCVRGTAFALTLEAGVGLIVYAIWLFLHVVH